MSYSWISIDKAIRKYHVTSEEIFELERKGKICRGPSVKNKNYGEKYQYSEWQISERFSLRDNTILHKENIATIAATALFTKTIDELFHVFSSDKELAENFTNRYPIVLHIPIELIPSIQQYQALRSISRFENTVHLLIETAIYFNNLDQLIKYFPTSTSKKYHTCKINLRVSEMVPISIFAQKHNLDIEEASLCFLNFGTEYIFDTRNKKQRSF